MKKQVTTFKKDQIISVHQGVSWMYREPKRELKEYVVTSVNGSSVYAKPVEFPDHTPERFDRKTLKTKSTMGGGTLRIIPEPDVFFAEWDKAERVKDLQADIKGIVEKVSNEDVLKQIQELLKQNAV